MVKIFAPRSFDFNLMNFSKVFFATHIKGCLKRPFMSQTRKHNRTYENIALYAVFDQSLVKVAAKVLPSQVLR